MENIWRNFNVTFNTFWPDLICNKILMVRNSWVWGVEFLIINVLLHTKSEKSDRKKVETRFFNKKYSFKIWVGRVCNSTYISYLKKQTFDGLLKVIGIQKKFQISYKFFHQQISF